MGNCANKPLTNEGGEAAPVEKAVEATAVDAVEREIKVDENKLTVDTAADAATAEDQTKPRSLAQVLEDEAKKPEVKEAAKPADEKPSSELAMVDEAKKEEGPKPVTEPAQPTTSIESAKQAASTEPAKATVSTEPAKPITIEPKKEETKPAHDKPVNSEPKKEETKPAETSTTVKKPEEPTPRKDEKKPESK